MADPQKIAKRLRDDRNQKGDQVKQLNEQLTLVDAVIDEYDEIINKLDDKIPPLIVPINEKIKAVETAYHARITHGCRSDLAWQLQETKKYSNNNNYEVYQVVKDPATYQFKGYYGAKYWKYPKNREYGANVVDVIDIADANVGSNTLVIFDEDAPSLTGFETGVTAGISTGDYITDSLDDALVFQSGNTPRVVGLGTTSYPGQRYAVSGFCTSGDTKIYDDQKIGFLTAFSIGDHVYGMSDKSGGGIIQNNTTITGFGTAVGIVTVVGTDSITTSISVTIDYAVLNNPVTASIAATVGHTFYVGITSTYYSVELSEQPSVSVASSTFLVIRPPDTGDITFESSKNPIDPVEIGIAKGAQIGKGHKLVLTNNGDPDIVAQWSEAKEEPEPKVGAGRIEYWVGTTNWPVYYPFNSGGGAVDPVYAPEGYKIICQIGGTANASLAYENTPPSGSIPGDCGTYDAAIATAESEMNAQIAQDTPKINHYINGAASLRSLRNDDETEAWGYLQAIGYINEKRKGLQKNADDIADFNWKDVGIT